jgi:Plasmid pRiA4b ORF-3-like protein
MTSERRSRAIFQLRVTLAGASPPIMRRLQVAEDTTLPQLHRFIQAMMNWEHYHLHEFVISGRIYAEPSPDDDVDRRIYDERRVRLSKVLKGVGAQFEYHYDFGDGWDHDLLLEAILLPEEGVVYPRCIAATRNAPPEDCGGIHGYIEYIEALKDRMHERHRELRDWRGPFDSEFVSVDLLNERLKLVSKLARMPALEPIYTSPYAGCNSRGRIEIELTARERHLIVNRTLADESLIRDLQATRKTQRYRFSWDDLDDLAGYVATEIQHEPDRKVKTEWTRLYDKLTAVLDSKAGLV